MITLENENNCTYKNKPQTLVKYMEDHQLLTVWHLTSILFY